MFYALVFVLGVAAGFGLCTLLYVGPLTRRIIKAEFRLRTIAECARIAARTGRPPG